jgi:hypothetical protein
LEGLAPNPKIKEERKKKEEDDKEETRKPR